MLTSCIALTLNPSPEGRGTLRSGSLLLSGEGLGMRAMQEGRHLLGLVHGSDFGGWGALGR
jgi:hypothetical protein